MRAPHREGLWEENRRGSARGNPAASGGHPRLYRRSGGGTRRPLTMATLIARPADPSSSFALDAAADTFPKPLRRNAGMFGARIAFRAKELGVWRPIRWATYYREAAAVGLGPRAPGLQRQEL